MDGNAKTRVSQSKPDPFVGKTFDGYRTEEVVGRGGMGSVYKATQLSLGRPVAIKILTQDLADDPQFLERFHREADVLSRLSHPNVVTVFERGEVEGRPYLVMEFVEGPSLRDVMREGPLTPADALKIVSSVLAALEHAHDRGIVHRDIKPENVLLARGDVVKVADFGLSRLLGPEEHTRLTRTQLMLGTYEYMAPEQRERSKEADERCDIYATGVVLYEMLVGELPIGRFDLPSRRRPKECDGRVDNLIERSLEKNPAERYQNAEEMAGAVSAILDHPSAAVPPKVERTGSGVSYRPARYEYHIDNLATIDHVLGTVCYVIGFVSIFGSGFARSWIGLPFFVFFIGGWYLRETSTDLRRYKQSARTAQAVISILAALTGVLIPFTIYSFWVLFGHRGRTYYDARSRGLAADEAARHTYRLMEEPFPVEHAAPARKPPPAPKPPTPSQIPVQSMVTSEVMDKPRPVRTSGLVKFGIFVLGCAIGWNVFAHMMHLPVAVPALAIPFAVAAAFLALGLLHSLFTPRVRGALLAFFLLALMVGAVYLMRGGM